VTYRGLPIRTREPAEEEEGREKRKRGRRRWRVIRSIS